MGMTADRWKGLLPACMGIIVACGAAIVVELQVLDAWRGTSISATAVLAGVAGLVTARRLFLRNRQPLITVRDLRRR